MVGPAGGKGAGRRRRPTCLNPPVPTTSDWIAGARPRTLPAAVAPVLAGTGVAAYAAEAVWWKALLALVVSLALQVGVNYANDYSDGVRGTDDDRVGPMRLVGSGTAAPAAVKRAAFAAFGVAAVAGLVLAATTAWWLVAVGALCVVAAWFYTGGDRPYGYLGLGEVMVFVFFGLVAVVGTRTSRRRRSRRPRSTPPSASARWPARSSSSTTCATSRPTRPRASAPSPYASASTAPAASTCCSSSPRRAPWWPWPPRRPGGRCSASASSPSPGPCPQRHVRGHRTRPGAGPAADRDRRAGVGRPGRRAAAPPRLTPARPRVVTSPSPAGRLRMGDSGSPPVRKAPVSPLSSSAPSRTVARPVPERPVPPRLPRPLRHRRRRSHRRPVRLLRSARLGGAAVRHQPVHPRRRVG